MAYLQVWRILLGEPKYRYIVLASMAAHVAAFLVGVTMIWMYYIVPKELHWHHSGSVFKLLAFLVIVITANVVGILVNATILL